MLVRRWAVLIGIVVIAAFSIHAAFNSGPAGLAGSSAPGRSAGGTAHGVATSVASKRFVFVLGRSSLPAPVSRAAVVVLGETGLPAMCRPSRTMMPTIGAVQPISLAMSISPQPCARNRNASSSARRTGARVVPASAPYRDRFPLISDGLLR